MREADPHYVSGPHWGAAGKHVDLVLERPDTRALILHPAGDPRRILGWLLYADVRAVPTVHFVYVRAGERERGYAAGLLRSIGVKQEEPSVYTCHGPGERLLLRRFRLATFYPLYMFLGLRSKERPVDEKWKANPREDPHR